MFNKKWSFHKDKVSTTGFQRVVRRNGKLDQDFCFFGEETTSLCHPEHGRRISLPTSTVMRFLASLGMTIAEILLDLSLNPDNKKFVVIAGKAKQSVLIFNLMIFFLFSLIPFSPGAFAEKPYILYHSPEIEMILSQALKDAPLSVPIYKIGVEQLDGKRMAVVQFGVDNEISRSEVARNALLIVSLCFAYDSKMERVDVYGTDKADVPDRKGEIRFSVSADRTKFHKVNFKSTSMDALETLGLVYYSDSVYDIPVSWLDFLKECREKPPKNKTNKPTGKKKQD